MSNPSTGGSTNGNAGSVRYFPGTGGGSVELIPDPSRFSVVFSTERVALSKAAQDVLRERSAAVKQIPHYGVRIYEGNSQPARDAAVVTLNRERAIDLAAPVMHRHSPDGEEVYVTRTVLVQFWPEVSRATIDELLASLGAAIVKSLDYALNGFQLLASAESGGLGAIALANALRASGHTIFAHPDLISRRHRRTITEERPLPTAAREVRDGDYVAQQWHLNFARISDAWSLAKGSRSITVAILDDGVDLTHPELDGRIVAQWDFSTGAEDGSPKTDDDKHGTACAGVALAGGLRASGAAPGCSLMAVRFPQVLGDSDEADMFRWAADNGADVISCSWGPADGTGQSDPLPGSTQAAIHYCLTTGRGGKGIPICWAAGNGNESVDLDGYASNPDVMAIAAINDHTTRSWYSDSGAAICIAGPSSGDRDAGERSITTIDRQGSAGYNDGSEGLDANYTNSFGGTSSASPLVAGIVGLMLSANPDLTATEVRTALQDTARKVGTGYDGQGHSPQYGYGLVDAYEAVRQGQAAAGKVTAAPGRPSIIGPATTAATDSAPRFEVDPGGGDAIYYAVEVATSSQLLDGGDHGSDDGFYASWQDSPFQSASPYFLPDAVWELMRGADALYYRAWFSTSANSWENVVVTTEDANFAQAPSITISTSGQTRSTRDAPSKRDTPPATHAGFDRLDYPGDDVMKQLWDNTNMAWTGFYLAPAPSQPNTSWMGKAAFLRSMGWGLAPIFVGQQWPGGKGSHIMTAAQGTTDAATAIRLADTAGIDANSVIYLDIEIGGRLPQTFVDYAQAWFAGIRGSSYRPGVYCSYLDTPAQLRALNSDLFFWVFNINRFTSSQFLDADGSFRAPPVDQSGCTFAIAWQYIQGATGVPVKHSDGTSTTFSPVDLDTATVLDPSHPEATRTGSGAAGSGSTGSGSTSSTDTGSTDTGTAASSGNPASIIGPASAPRSGPAPRFDVAPAEGSPATFYAVEVATDPALFDDASHSIDEGFYASWNDSAFLSVNPYVLPDAAWQHLGGSASALYYRAWFSSSDSAWADTQVTTPASERSSAPSISITDDSTNTNSTDSTGTDSTDATNSTDSSGTNATNSDSGNTDASTGSADERNAPRRRALRTVRQAPRHPEITGPATAVRGGQQPVFAIALPATARSWWLEVTTGFDLFGLDSSADRTAANFWASESLTPGIRSLAMAFDAWSRLQSTDRLYYRVGTSTAAADATRYLQDSSTSPLTPDAAPWIEILPAAERDRSATGGPTRVTDSDELKWRGVSRASRSDRGYQPMEAGRAK